MLLFFSYHVVELILKIEKHWMSNNVPEMTLEKLQMIATCNTLSQQKINLLKWWNSPMPFREARKFPMHVAEYNPTGNRLKRHDMYPNSALAVGN